MNALPTSGARKAALAFIFVTVVDEARKVTAGDDHRRAAQEAAYRFMQAMAGNEAGFEDAARALFAGDFGGFEEQIQHWPDDVRDHAALLAADAFIG